jgi:putative ABC transport system permease protein
MRVIGALIAAWLDTRSHPVRTVAALLGMIAAVAAVIVIDSANVLSTQAGQEFLAREYGRPATLELTATQPLSAPSAANAADGRLESTLRASGFPELSFYSTDRIAVFFGDRTTLTNGALTTPAFAKIHVVTVKSGVLPRSPGSGDSPVLHASIDANTAANLGLTPATAVGEQLRYEVVRGAGAPEARYDDIVPFVVDAVTAPDPNETFGAGVLFFAAHITPEWVGHGNLYWFAHVRPDDVARAQNTVASLTQPGDSTSESFSAARIDRDEQLGPILDQQRLTARAVSLVALVVGGLGILAVGMATTRELRRVYALRRALGARRSSIFAGVLTESVLKSAIAALLAVTIAWLIVSTYRRDLVLATLPLPDSSGLPAASATRGILSALAVGLLAGLAPAVSAARGSIVAALRE